MSKNNLKGKCGDCQYRSICGGCRSIANAYYGDYLMSDPQCWYEPEKSGKSSEINPI